MIKEALLKLADIANCVSGDFHLMHLNYKGADFDVMHKEVLQKYYEEAADDYDTFAEAACMFGTFVESPNDSATRVEWDSQKGEFHYTLATETIETLLDTYCGALILVFNELNKETSAVSVGIANTVQTRIEYWSKELLYFNARRKP